MPGKSPGPKRLADANRRPGGAGGPRWVATGNRSRDIGRMTLEAEAEALARGRTAEEQLVIDRYRRVVAAVGGLAREFAPAAASRLKPELMSRLTRPCWLVRVVSEAGQSFARTIAVYQDGSWAWAQFSWS